MYTIVCLRSIKIQRRNEPEHLFVRGSTNAGTSIRCETFPITVRCLSKEGTKLFKIIEKFKVES